MRRPRLQLRRGSRDDAMNENNRPDPDALLARYGFTGRDERGEGRGQLHVFLGAAPGVGKTYAMLREGQRLSQEGRDVVVGFIETHSRAETEAQIGSLEILPRQSIRYRGVTVEEMDTVAILSREPEVVLVDELAHTNAPGSERVKRWQDVELLRDAGIDVMTTLNVQHLESLKDIVDSITGIHVNETLPDRVLDSATDVQLVDLPVEGLIERLETGRVYPPQRARQALENFFRPGNLTALRELALRQTAAGVDERLEEYMREHRIDEVWPAAARVAVLVAAGGNYGNVLRGAWRLADGLRADLMAVAIVPPGGINLLPADSRRDIERALALAEDLGATAVMVESLEIVSGVASAVREHNASILVIGYQPESGLKRLRHASLVDQLLHELQGVAIHIVETHGKPA